MIQKFENEHFGLVANLSEDLANSYREIPKKLHFIWHTSVIPEKQGNIVKEWKRKNPDYEVNVWYDKTLLTPEDDVKFKNWAVENNINLLDTNENLPPNKHAKYETAGPFPNPAARSDIERFTILSLHGGIYLDTDIKTTSIPLPEKLYSKTGVLFNHFAGEESFVKSIDELKDELNKELDFEFLLDESNIAEDNGNNKEEVKGKIREKSIVTNDVSIAEKDHPLINYICKKLNSSYINDQLCDSLQTIQNDAKRKTLAKTGPDFLRQTLDKKEEAVETHGKFHLLFSNLTLKNDFCIDPQYFDCREGDCSWLEIVKKNSSLEIIRLKEKKYSSMASYYEDILLRVSYELEFYGKSLLEEYIKFGKLDKEYVDLLRQRFEPFLNEVNPPISLNHENKKKEERISVSKFKKDIMDARDKLIEGKVLLSSRKNTDRLSLIFLAEELRNDKLTSFQDLEKNMLEFIQINKRDLFFGRKNKNLQLIENLSEIALLEESNQLIP